MFGPFVNRGYTFDDVRRMTLHDVALAHGYWKRNPPLEVLMAVVAKSLGVEFPEAGKKPDDQSGKYMTEQEFRLMMRATGGKIPGLGQFGGPSGTGG